MLDDDQIEYFRTAFPDAPAKAAPPVKPDPAKPNAAKPNPAMRQKPQKPTTPPP